MSRDFLDSYAIELLARPEPTPTATPAQFPDGTGRHAFTGFRCDHPGCSSSLLGKTDTRAQLHALTARAELGGWQCRLVNGKAMHWCPQHVDPAHEQPTRSK